MSKFYSLKKVKTIILTTGYKARDCCDRNDKRRTTQRKGVVGGVGEEVQEEEHVVKQGRKTGRGRGFQEKGWLKEDEKENAKEEREEEEENAWFINFIFIGLQIRQRWSSNFLLLKVFRKKKKKKKDKDLNEEKK